MNPFNPYTGVRPAQPLEVGMGDSGPETIVLPDKPERILKIAKKQISPGGYDGLASVHVAVRDVEVIPPGEEPANAMLLLDISWHSGLAGGEQTIDATRGAFFTVGASNALNITARLVSSVEGEPVVPWASKLVAANVHWLGSINAIKAKITTPSIVLAPDVPSAFMPIPLQSESMMAYTLEPQFLDDLVVEFSTSNLASGIKYRTLNPNANGSHIVHGVEFFRFVSPNAMTVFADFELW